MEKTSPIPKTVKCPTCAATVKWTPAERSRPFCSERCKLIDLGDWYDGTNRIAAEEGIPTLPDSENI